MDKGEFIKTGYSIEPGDGGSFIALQGSAQFRRENGVFGAMRGFTSYADLLTWLAAEHEAVDAKTTSKGA